MQTKAVLIKWWERKHYILILFIIVMALTDGAIIGIAIAGGIAAFILLLILLIYLLRKWAKGPTTGSDNLKTLEGKVVAITGANTGIGKITAIDLARRGARVIILCRNLEKAAVAVQDIKDESSNQLVEVEELDLSSLMSVRQCADTLNKKHKQLDFLINNAGVAFCPDSKTEDGFEMQFATNHLGHFLLTELLMPLIRESVNSGFHPRIVIVSSMVHRMSRNGMDFDNLNAEKGYKSDDAYVRSKLANILHAKVLAERLEESGISVYVLHPGMVGTDAGRHMKDQYFMARCLMPCMFFMIKTPFYGAQTTLYCTLEDTIEDETGCYYSDCSRKEPSGHAQDMEAAKRLWEVSETLVGLKENV